ncbi:Microcystin-dependent protein [Chitinophaga jiangningensis]|uniref:Microcystin-dependent protein n=1 Tax=Chitinophaga jiangningensis TaxID=1419482 RepID=A0A1M7J2Y5_9BACT|nr:tail fiber protein [Chitinophaga jiangningensis]SHM47328.1 Microcystin-dependent protein [Chitinophaga jiangningensis]
MPEDVFLGQIFTLAGGFAPVNSELCEGQLIPISRNTALFALLGTYFGGDGKSTFALPDMQGKVPIGAGQGTGLSDRFLGEQGGSPGTTLLASEMPAHVHTIPQTVMTLPVGTAATSGTPVGNYHGAVSTAKIYGTADSGTSMEAGTALYLDNEGGNQPLINYQPTLAVSFCIATAGIFPQRS